MRIVITGASGFLGQAVMRRLRRDGHEVVAVSRQALPDFAQVGDYADSPLGDVLVHLAEANDRRWVESQGDAYQVAARQTLQILLDKGYGRVVYASSAVLYGDQYARPCREDDTVALVDAYTRLKSASEQAVTARGGVAVRLANLYGLGMSQANVLSAILKQLPLDGPVQVMDVTPIRDFLWVEDAADALAVMVSGRPTGVFNVGSGQGISILDLARMVLHVVDQSDRSIESQYQGPCRSRLVVDIEHTAAVFDWRPSSPLLDALRAFVGTINLQEKP